MHDEYIHNQWFSFEFAEGIYQACFYAQPSIKHLDSFNVEMTAQSSNLSGASNHLNTDFQYHKHRSDRSPRFEAASRRYAEDVPDDGGGVLQARHA